MFACVGNKSDASVFEGKTMVLMTLAEGELVPSELKEPVTIMFNSEEKSVNGYSGCNRFFGGYTLEGDKITFGNVGCTRMMCDPISNDVESKVLNILNTANRFETTEHTVIFFKDDVRLGEFCNKSNMDKCANECGKKHECTSKRTTCELPVESAE